jgi:hypothetical protein
VTRFSELASRESATLGGKFHQEVDVVALAVEFLKLDLEAGAHVPHDLLHPREVPALEHRVPVLGHEGQSEREG